MKRSLDSNFIASSTVDCFLERKYKTTTDYYSLVNFKINSNSDGFTVMRAAKERFNYRLWDAYINGISPVYRKFFFLRYKLHLSMQKISWKLNYSPSHLAYINRKVVVDFWEILSLKEPFELSKLVFNVKFIVNVLMAFKELMKVIEANMETCDKRWLSKINYMYLLYNTIYREHLRYLSSNDDTLFTGIIKVALSHPNKYSKEVCELNLCTPQSVAVYKKTYIKNLQNRVEEEFSMKFPFSHEDNNILASLTESERRTVMRDLQSEEEVGFIVTNPMDFGFSDSDDDDFEEEYEE